MSLMGTLAKVAVGMAVAKGVKSLAGGGGRSSGGGLGDLLGQLGGAASGRRQTGGGVGDLLGQLTGGGAGSARNDGLGLENIMGGVFKNASGQNAGGIGGLGGLLDGLAGANAPAGTGAGGIGDLLNQSFEHFGEPKAAPTPAQDETAGVMLKAMLQAAMSDGRIDASEKQALFKNLGDVSKDEIAFVNTVMDAPVDPKALAREVPSGAEAQTYMMSLIAIDLDSEVEAQYLNKFAVALGLEERQVNRIHAKMDEPPLYG